MAGRGVFLILGGIFLHSCVAGCLMRPVGPSPNTKKSKSKVGSRHDSTLKKASKVSTAQKVNRFLDFSLFMHRGFLIYLSGNVILFLGIFAPIIFLAQYAKHIGVDDYNSAFFTVCDGFY